MIRPYVALALAALLLACAGGDSPSGGMRKASEELQEGRVEDAQQTLETLREQHPDDIDVRLELADFYYQRARLALDGGDQAEYLRLLGAAQDEILAAVAIDPAASRPHTMMGIVAAYQGDLDTAMESFRNASRLAPFQGVSYTNLAHIWVYKGKLSRARTLLDKGRKFRGPPDEIDRIEILAAWRGGDFTEAQDVFDMALVNPGFAESWDGAPLPEPMEDFDDFAEVCCANPTCGPNMGSACRKAQLKVKRRELEEETVRQELQLEMERRRKLLEIYERRRDLEITVEAPADEAEE
ncbi:MAG: DUF6584 family protein [Myxococcota bacterium]